MKSFRLLQFVLMSFCTSSLGCGGEDKTTLQADEASLARLDLEMKDLVLSFDAELATESASSLNELKISDASPKNVFAKYGFISPAGTTHIKVIPAESSFGCPEGGGPDSVSYVLFPAGHTENRVNIDAGKTYPLREGRDMVLAAKIANARGCRSMDLNFRVQIIRN